MPKFLYKQVWLSISYYDIGNKKISKSFETQDELDDYIEEVNKSIKDKTFFNK